MNNSILILCSGGVEHEILDFLTALSIPFEVKEINNFVEIRIDKSYEATALAIKEKLKDSEANKIILLPTLSIVDSLIGFTQMGYHYKDR